MAESAILELLKGMLNKLTGSSTVLELLKEGASSSDDVFKIVFLSNAVANDILYRNASPAEARKVLEFGRELVCGLAASRVKSPMSQNDLEKMLTLLSIEDLYTTNTYVIGRTHLLEGNLVEAWRCFQLAKDLGERFKLFEFVLSERSGLNNILEKEIEKLIWF